VLKLFTDILDPTFKCMGVQKEKDQIAVIVGLDRSHIEQELQTLRAKMDKFKLLLSKVVDFTVCIALGGHYSSLDHIELSYLDACNALKYRMVYGDNTILIFRSIMNEIDDQYYYPLQQETHILNYLKAGLRTELLDVLDRFMAELGNKKLSYDNLNQIFNQLLANVIHYLISNHIIPDDLFKSDKTLYQQLSRLETIQDVHRWFADVLVTIIEWVETEQDSENHNIKRIHEYIHHHFRSDIEIGSVAEYAGISYSHLRRIFARRFGTNIYNYINTLRVEEAKTLLKSTDLSIEEIALQVGYNNNQSFNRFFKKYEGITPGSYRNH
jgi:AraC-like DNA-binding protein